MGWQERFHEDIKWYLGECGVDDIEKVIDFEEDTYSGGYCETCWYESELVTVTYLNSDGDTLRHDEYMSMSDFLDSITRRDADDDV